MTTFFQHVKDGVRFAYVYHISGMDWAATTDPDFAAWYNAQGVAAQNYGALMFGFSKDQVQMLPVLSPELGSQTINSSREGGIDVGSWSVTVGGDCSGYKFGKLFPYVPYTGWQQGLTGLNWTPDTTQPEIVFGIMSRDLRLSRESGDLVGGLAPGTLYFRKDQDFGLKSFIDALTPAVYPFVWIGSSCLLIADDFTDEGDEWSVPVLSGLFSSPLEDLFFTDSVRYQITTVPLETAGRTSRLFAVPIDVTETIEP